PLGLGHDLLADRRHPHCTLGTFEQQHPQLLLQLLHTDAEGGLGYMAALGSVAEMLFLGEGHYVTKFGQGHVVYCSLRFSPSITGCLIEENNQDETSGYCRLWGPGRGPGAAHAGAGVAGQWSAPGSFGAAG